MSTSDKQKVAQAFPQATRNFQSEARDLVVKRFNGGDPIRIRSGHVMVTALHQSLCGHHIPSQRGVSDDIEKTADRVTCPKCKDLLA
jgi:hypothetical protein